MFMKPVIIPIREEEELKEVFKSFDWNNDGVLDKNELRQAFKRLGSHLAIWRAFIAMQKADANGDGVISTETAELAELIKYAKKLGFTVPESAKRNPYMNRK